MLYCKMLGEIKKEHGCTPLLITASIPLLFILQYKTVDNNI